MGRVFRSYLAGESVFSCRSCGNHLAVRESVISDVSGKQAVGSDGHRKDPTYVDRTFTASTARRFSSSMCEWAELSGLRLSPPRALLTLSVNIYTSPQAEDRTMLTGRHTVRDLYCRECRATLGWTYVSAVVDYCGRLLRSMLDAR
jgi:hypothetical protein